MQDNNGHSWCMLSTYKGITYHVSQYTIQSQAWSVHCPTGVQIRLVMTNDVLEFCYCFDYW